MNIRPHRHLIILSSPSPQVSLKKLLEDGQRTKLVFDVRSDAAQLAREYSVRLRCGQAASHGPWCLAPVADGREGRPDTGSQNVTGS